MNLAKAISNLEINDITRVLSEDLQFLSQRFSFLEKRIFTAIFLCQEFR